VAIWAGGRSAEEPRAGDIWVGSQAPVPRRVVAVTVLGTAGNPLPSDVWAPVTGALVVVECSVHAENSHGSQSA
jgi:hypothetical protein